MRSINLLCHRKPERSFHIKGKQFPVCSRCTGFYISIIAYYTYTFFNYVDYNPFLLSSAILLLIPAGIDGTTQFLGYRESNNTLRFITGLLGGLGLAILIKALKYFLYTNGGIL